MSALAVGVFGLGEAGTLIAADLAAAGVRVKGYDPVVETAPPDVELRPDPVSAVRDANVVLAITAERDAPRALSQALEAIPSDALYADLSTSAPATKRELAAVAAGRGLAFVDVALMSIVPGRGIRTPALAAGDAARRFANLFAPLGMPVEPIGMEAGLAQTRKLLRSVLMKGLACLFVETLRGGEAAGCSEWLWESLTDELEAADEALVARLLRGTARHAERRLHEMEASVALLEELGVDPVMTRSTVERLRRVFEEGVPEPPLQQGTGR